MIIPFQSARWYKWRVVHSHIITRTTGPKPSSIDSSSINDYGGAHLTKNESQILVAGPMAASSKGPHLRPTTLVSTSEMMGVASQIPRVGMVKRRRARKPGTSGASGGCNTSLLPLPSSACHGKIRGHHPNPLTKETLSPFHLPSTLPFLLAGSESV